MAHLSTNKQALFFYRSSQAANLVITVENFKANCSVAKYIFNFEPIISNRVSEKMISSIHYTYMMKYSKISIDKYYPDF